MLTTVFIGIPLCGSPLVTAGDTAIDLEITFDRDLPFFSHIGSPRCKLLTILGFVVNFKT